MQQQRCQDYMEALEEERRKIQVFKRELPLCLELVTQAIEACKQQQQLSGTTTENNLNAQSECSEQTSSEAPVLEEFIPLKSSTQHQESHHNSTHIIEKDTKKSDWLRSVQLWNQSSTQDSRKTAAVVEVKTNGAFHPFKFNKDKNNKGESRSVAPPASTSDKEKEKESQRKARRCWSSELHRKFLQALQQLGGSHLATPKQIRELMKVDGLTNDEVKSHLQKYRLHTRRPSPSIQNNSNTQTPQFVVVGGIWMPPEYAAMATTATSGSGEASGVATSNGIYAPVATLPPAKQQRSDSEGGVRSHSPATSSSTHTTTASAAH